MGYGAKGLMILIVLLAAAWLSGCKTSYFGNPTTPTVTAFVSDNQTRAGASFGSVGEFTFRAAHSRTADGATSGTVYVQQRKRTMDHITTNFFSGLFGYLLALVK